MKKTFLLLLICTFFSCAKNPEKPNAVPDGVALNKNNYYEAVILKKWTQEYLPYDSILINGTIPLLTTKKVLYALLGKPNKIFPIKIDRNNFPLLNKNNPRNANYLVYGNTIFEAYDEDVIVNTIDFESTNIELVSPKITLKKDIAPFIVQRAFPESGRLIKADGGGNTWAGNIMIAASNTNGNISRVWFCTFRGERLCRVVLYSLPTFDN